MRKSIMLGLTAGLTAPAVAVTTPVDKFYLPLTGTTAAQDPELKGTVVRDKLVSFVLTDSAKTHGTIQVRTVRGSSGKLSFYWKINVAADSKGAVSIMHVGGVPNHGYQADWRPDGLGTVAPAAIGGAVTTKTKQFDIYFQFGKPVAAGQSSRFLYIKTDATSAGKGFAVLGGSNGLSAQIGGEAPLF